MSTYSYTGEIVTETFASAGTISITAYGAQGGTPTTTFHSHGTGGDGAEIGGTFSVAKGEVIEIIVGGMGGSSSSSGGGGGGSFVIETFNGTSAVHSALVIAGGGGGGGIYGSPIGDGGPGLTGTSGGDGHGYSGFAGTGGTNGAGGHGGVGTNNSWTNAGGGGYSGGDVVYNARGGTGGGKNTGYAGGSGVRANGADGGFGGGGGSYGGGGGGGGYGGGGGGGVFEATYIGYGGGGGGGSVDRGSNKVEIAGENAGNGKVVIDLLCYLRGTHILTPTGEKFVENLRIGDLVVTRFGGIKPVKWIGRQSFDARFVKGNRNRIPVCIKAGALGEKYPARDLYVSPGHSILIENILVAAENLANGVTITQDFTPPRIDYFNIELDGHDCVVAEGIWAETYADAEGMRAQFHNMPDYETLYPNEPPATVPLCAERPEQGAKFEAALRPASARAAAATEPGKLRGYIDTLDTPWKITGWAQDIAHPELPVLLEVVLKGEVIGSVLACNFREDLKDAGIGTGRCAFSFTSPIRLEPGALATLQLRRAGGQDLLEIAATCVNLLKETGQRQAA